MSLIPAGVIFGVLLSGCSLSPADPPAVDIPRFATAEDASVWVHDFIQPVPSDSWEGVQEILKNRQGDCKQYAILLMWILNEQFGMKSELVGVDIPQHGGHAVVHADGCWYDPTLGYYWPPPNVFPWPTTFTWSYDDAMTQASLGLPWMIKL